MSRRSSSPRRRGLLPLGVLAGAVLLALGAVVVLTASTSSTRRSGTGMTALSAAKIAYVDGEYERAEELLRALGNDPEVLSLLGRVLLERGNVPKAQEVLSALLKSDPENYDATRAMAEVYKRQGQLDLAIVYLTRATELRRDDARAWRELGLAQRERGDVYGAMSSLQQSLALDKDQADLSRLVSELAMAKDSRPGMNGLEGLGVPGLGAGMDPGGFNSSPFQTAGRIPRPQIPDPAREVRQRMHGFPK